LSILGKTLFSEPVRKREKIGAGIGRSMRDHLERRETLEQRVEREWKSVRCPHGEGRVRLMCEWKVIAVEGRILKKELTLIDCHHPPLARFGGESCGWDCMKVVSR